jgi:hypothetical protein
MQQPWRGRHSLGQTAVYKRSKSNQDHTALIMSNMLLCNKMPRLFRSQDPLCEIMNHVYEAKKCLNVNNVRLPAMINYLGLLDPGSLPSCLQSSRGFVLTPFQIFGHLSTPYKVAFPYQIRSSLSVVFLPVIAHFRHRTRHSFDERLISKTCRKVN